MTDRECVNRFAAAVCAMQGVGLMLDGFKQHLEPSALPPDLRDACASYVQQLDSLASHSALLYHAALAWLRENQGEGAENV